MRQVFLSAHQNAAAFLFILDARITDSSSASSLIFAACPSSRLITVSRAILLALIGSDGERLAADRADAVVCRPNSMIGVPPLVVAVSTAKSFLFPVWIGAPHVRQRTPVFVFVSVFFSRLHIVLMVPTGILSSCAIVAYDFPFFLIVRIVLFSISVMEKPLPFTF